MLWDSDNQSCGKRYFLHLVSFQSPLAHFPQVGSRQCWQIETALLLHFSPAHFRCFQYSYVLKAIVPPPPFEFELQSCNCKRSDEFPMISPKLVKTLEVSEVHVQMRNLCLWYSCWKTNNFQHI